eukprot:4767295-Pyramimonas_sp.AAC.1
MVPRDRAITAITPWLVDPGWEEDGWQLHGGMAAKRFTIKCKGAPGCAVRRACHALGALRQSSGSDRRFNIMTIGSNIPKELFTRSRSSSTSQRIC